MKKIKVLEVENLKVKLKGLKNNRSIINNVSFPLYKGRVLGIIGESGCGKSVTCLSLMGLLDKTSWQTTGHCYFRGRDLNTLSENELRQIRGKEVSMIMQNPMQAFDSVVTIGGHFRESINSHQLLTKKEANLLAVEMLAKMKLPDPKGLMQKYPFQCSGGMLQRVMIAIALVNQPTIIIADEPTTALDVTVQQQILAQLNHVKESYHTAMLLVSHDLGVIAQMADEVAVMYGGYIVEKGMVKDIFNNPLHPYTRALIQSRPTFTKTRLRVLEGYPQPLTEIINGCPFKNRCQWKERECEEYTMYSSYLEGEQMVKCIRYSSGNEVKESVFA